MKKLLTASNVMQDFETFRFYAVGSITFKPLLKELVVILVEVQKAGQEGYLVITFSNVGEARTLKVGEFDFDAINEIRLADQYKKEGIKNKHEGQVEALICLDALVLIVTADPTIDINFYPNPAV